MVNTWLYQTSYLFHWHRPFTSVLIKDYWDTAKGWQRQFGSCLGQEGHSVCSVFPQPNAWNYWTMLVSVWVRGLDTLLLYRSRREDHWRYAEHWGYVLELAEDSMEYLWQCSRITVQTSLFFSLDIWNDGRQGSPGLHQGDWPAEGKAGGIISQGVNLNCTSLIPLILFPCLFPRLLLKTHWMRRSEARRENVRNQINEIEILSGLVSSGVSYNLV